MTQTTTIGPITLADVKAALADTDPNNTNAGAVRAILGRGSMATIQKHLDSIRAELAPAPPVAPGATPAAPADAIAQIWGSAWAAAQILTLGRLETVTAERDAARALAATQERDLGAALANVDILTDATAEAQKTSATILAALQEFEGKATTEVAAHAAALEAAQAQTEQVKSDAATAAAAAAAALALADRDHTIAMQAIQQIVDRQSTEVGQLRSLLDRLTPAAIAAPEAKVKAAKASTQQLI